LQSFITFPTPKFPDLNAPEDPRRITDQDIEQYAAYTRKFWGIGDGPISNVLWLVENNGAIVSRYELGARKLDAFSQWREADNAPFIVLGSDKSSASRS